MLAYRKIFLLILIFSVLIIVLAWEFSFLNTWLILLLILVNIIVLLAGSFCVCSGLYIQALCSGSADTKKVSITFDDGPDKIITPQVLDLLKQHDIKAGFFLVGKNIEGNEEIVKRMINEGHIIGNHSYSHKKYFGFLGTGKVKEDLQKNEALIERVTGKRVAFFRPPFGVSNPNIARAARLLDYTVLGWSIRSFDTVSRNNDKTIKRVFRRLKPGGMILFHDNNERILPILKTLIEKISLSGYEIVSPEELLNIKAYKE
jgi:peptidoglycan/xylan/chitin deacetylase (PgdA/CDA1 family)